MMTSSSAGNFCITDWIDLADVKQPPLEGAGLRRESFVHEYQQQDGVSYPSTSTTPRWTASPLCKTAAELQQQLATPATGVSAPARSVGRDYYYSFSQCIAEEVPPHYRQFYVNYDRCKDLIRYLDAANEELKRGVHCTSTVIPTKTQQMLDESLESLLAAHASSLDDRVVRALVPQVVFSDTIRQELNKVNNFAALSYSRIETALKDAWKKLRELIATDKQCLESQHQLSTESGASDSKRLLSDHAYETWRHNQLQEVELALDAQAAEIIHLDMFSRFNYKGFVRLAALFDKVMATTILPWTSATVIRELFANVDIDHLLISISLAWNKYRSALTRDYADAHSTWIPPESFIRSTTKYWVRPDQVVMTKLTILKHMPYLIFGCSDEDLEEYFDCPPAVNPTTPLATPATSPTTSCPIVPEESQLVSSIYLDSPSTAYSYNRRTLRLEGAELIRFRWYGSNDGDPNQDIFVERKTHHESWTGESSTKERFSIPQKKVFDFMKGKLDIDAWASKEARREGKSLEDKKFKNMIRLGHEVQELIMKEKLQPIVRTSYLRAAFQQPTSNDVRFSLDTNLCMVNELIPNGHPEQPWCRIGEEICGKEEVVRFPCAVLEIKLQAHQPPWVSNMLAEVGAIMVYKFSKFQHGMAFLHRDIVSHLAIPHWIPEFESRGYGPGYKTAPVFDFALDGGRKDTLGSCVSFGSGALLNSDRQHEESPFLPTLSLSPSHGNPIRRLGQSILRWLRKRPQHVSDAELLFERGHPRKVDTKVEGKQPIPERIAVQRESVKGPKTPPHPIVDPNQFPTLTLQWMKPLSATLPQDDVERLLLQRSFKVRKIDPKSYFANERTFLHYLQKALYLGGLAIALTTFGTSRVNTIGILLYLVALILILYCYRVFTERSDKLNRRMTRSLEEDRLDSKWGPVIVFALVTVTIVAAIAANLGPHHTPAISKILRLPHRPVGSHGHHHSSYRGVATAPFILRPSGGAAPKSKSVLFQEQSMSVPLQDQSAPVPPFPLNISLKEKGPSTALRVGLRGIISMVLGVDTSPFLQ